MPPRTKSFNAIGLDVHDIILCHIPDFSTLRGAVEASKTLRVAYFQHKHTINVAVAKNQGGPTWFDALLATRVKEGRIPLDYLVKLNLNTEAECSGCENLYPNDMLSDTGYPTEYEISKIRVILASAKKFEQHFSIRFVS